jgi:uncharacterized protein YcaQ
MLLAAQGLLDRPMRAATKNDVLATIRRMGALQIDTIHVVARSPYLVLWSRLGAYQAHWLDELLAEGQIFEYWSHAACFLPIEHYPLYRREMLEDRPRARAWMAAHHDVVDRVRMRLHEEGEVRSASFERTDGRAGSWWDWKPEKTALECLFSTGEVMIARRDRNFHRVYAPRERALPTWDDAELPAPHDAERALTLKAVHALGVTKAAWVPDYFRRSKKRVGAMLNQLCADGILARVEVEGWKEPGFIHADIASLAVEIMSCRRRKPATTLLSPFDPVVWDRKRASELFGFDYRIETYTPEAKRRYGYFTLPILHGCDLVGRLDAKAHRAEGCFSVKSVHLEPGVIPTPSLLAGLLSSLQECAAWHQTPTVEILRSDPPALAQELTETINMNPAPTADSG